MIAAGAALLHRFAWMTYFFGALLLVSAARMLVARHDNLGAEENLVVRTARRWIPVSEDFHGARFFVVQDGVRMATPLLVVLLMVETTDILFAVDSIPAIFAVTDQPFIVYTSNIFALLGLRSLYFALAPMLERLRYLKASLVFLLAYVGVKMLLTHSHPIPAAVSLAMVGGILGVGVIASLIGAGRDTAPLSGPFAAGQLMRTTVERAREGVALIVGGTVVLLGSAVILLPAPALLVLPPGLALLAVQLYWARRFLNGVGDRAPQPSADQGRLE
jgi:tellurite resistance protein TerC